jgi:toxin-antitoxin system PIN domain toxin
MKSSLFPDINVWLALAHDRHVHHAIAADWFQPRQETLFFCRFTQLGFLRLLTNEQVMGVDAMTQTAAWREYHRWFDDERVAFHREPETPEFETMFQGFSSKGRRSPKLWADAYLAAFARTSGLTLVTFDKAFRAMASVPAMVLSTD